MRRVAGARRRRDPDRSARPGGSGRATHRDDRRRRARVDDPGSRARRAHRAETGWARRRCSSSWFAARTCRIQAGCAEAADGGPRKPGEFGQARGNQPEFGIGEARTDRIGYLPQRVDGLDEAASVLENVREAASAVPDRELRNRLACFLIRGAARWIGPWRRCRAVSGSGWRWRSCCWPNPRRSCRAG